MVAQARHMELDAVRKLADGWAYTGRRAKTLGLVDAIGSAATSLRTALLGMQDTGAWALWTER